MGRFLGITVKKGGSRVGAWTGTVKNPTKCLWRWEPDRRFNFFNPPAHLCAVTYMTEISLNVTLNNQIHITSHPVSNSTCGTAYRATAFSNIERYFRFGSFVV